MSDQFHRDSWHRARVTHDCAFCRRDIEPGQRYQSNRGVFEGYWYTYALHQRCRGVVDALMVDCEFGEGVDFDELRGWLREHVASRNPDRPINKGVK